MTTSHAPQQATVLLVDDNPTNLQVLFRTLESSGHRLLAASNGEDAIHNARKTKPDLILLDIMMPPGIDGYETLRRIKQDPMLADSAVIFLSSLDETDNKVRGLELGAVDYITKPFRADEVIARVNTHLTIQRLQAELAERNASLVDANARMKADLEAAGRVQRALLPASVPDCDGLTFGWQCVPCAELGGDALDIFWLDETTVGFYLLDVSGHGVPASLLAVAATRSLAPRADRSSLVVETGWDRGAPKVVSPSEVLRRLNVVYPMESGRNPHFMTCIYGHVDTQSGELRFANAGHPSPIVIRANGELELVSGGSPPIGVLPDTQYEDLRLLLDSGDRLFVHSDGVNEQPDRAGEEFGCARLISFLRESTQSVDVTLTALVANLHCWAGDSALKDDLSVLGIGRFPEMRY